MRAYQPSGKVPVGGFLLLLIATIIGSVVAGLIMFAVEYYFNLYLVIFFPIIAGFIAAGAMALAIQVGKIRNRWVPFLVGILGAVLLYGTYHFAGYYIGFRGVIQEETRQELTQDELTELTDEILEEEFGYPGFRGYMEFLVEQGVTINRTINTSGSSGIDLSGSGVWIYFGVELLVIALVMAFSGRGRAGQPFDESSEQWYGPPTFLAVADAKGRARKDFTQTWKSGDIASLGRLLTTFDAPYPRAEVYTRMSPDSNSSSDVLLLTKFVQRRGRNAENGPQGMLTVAELDLLKKQMGQVPPLR
jgi:hypothetical protein